MCMTFTLLLMIIWTLSLSVASRTSPKSQRLQSNRTLRTPNSQSSPAGNTDTQTVSSKNETPQVVATFLVTLIQLDLPLKHLSKFRLGYRSLLAAFSFYFKGFSISFIISLILHLCPSTGPPSSLPRSETRRSSPGSPLSRPRLPGLLSRRCNHGNQYHHQTLWSHPTLPSRWWDTFLILFVDFFV